MQTKQNIINSSKLIGFSFLSAMPIGFMCYFAYQSILPIPLNVLISCIVTLVNTAIGYTAVLNLFIAFREVRSSLFDTNFSGIRISKGELVFRIFGFLIGVMVSLTAYMAAIHGIMQLLQFDFLNHDLSYKFAIAIGFLNWVPYAALFANSAQSVFSKLYQFVVHFSLKVKQLNSLQLLIFIVAWCSGASFAEIVLDYFNPAMDIPTFIKSPEIQSFIIFFLVPAAYLVSFTVNYLALQNLAYRYAPE